MMAMIGDMSSSTQRQIPRREQIKNYVRTPVDICTLFGADVMERNAQ